MRRSFFGSQMRVNTSVRWVSGYAVDKASKLLVKATVGVNCQLGVKSASSALGLANWFLC